MLKPGFLPFGPPESRDGGECFAPLVYNDLLCAAARRNAWKQCPGLPEKHRKLENPKFWSPVGVNSCIWRGTLDYHLEVWNHPWKAQLRLQNDKIWCLEPYIGMKFKFDDEVVNVTQIRQIRKFARRAALTREMEESASHQLFSFALRSCAPKCLKTMPAASGERLKL